MVGMLEHPSLEIASLALEFWGMLGELLTETAAGGRGPRSPPLEESVRHACRVSMLRARYPSDDGGGLGGMDEDSRDELEDFRDQVCTAVAVGPELGGIVVPECDWDM